ncbi:MAG TPA: hypothetical protein VJ855_03285, partial [Marinilabiliaceae bacterium]|nr:hypothetical protein [Marinilabiliaceae bacterium]
NIFFFMLFWFFELVNLIVFLLIQRYLNKHKSTMTIFSNNCTMVLIGVMQGNISVYIIDVMV